VSYASLSSVSYSCRYYVPNELPVVFGLDSILYFICCRPMGQEQCRDQLCGSVSLWFIGWISYSYGKNKRLLGRK